MFVICEVGSYLSFKSTFVENQTLVIARCDNIFTAYCQQVTDSSTIIQDFNDAFDEINKQKFVDNKFARLLISTIKTPKHTKIADRFYQMCINKWGIRYVTKRVCYLLKSSSNLYDYIYHSTTETKMRILGIDNVDDFNKIDIFDTVKDGDLYSSIYKHGEAGKEVLRLYKPYYNMLIQFLRDSTYLQIFQNTAHTKSERRFFIKHDFKAYGQSEL